MNESVIWIFLIVLEGKMTGILCLLPLLKLVVNPAGIGNLLCVSEFAKQKTELNRKTVIVKKLWELYTWLSKF